MMNLSPRNVFLLDGTGALLTAFLTGIILTAFAPYFGMPVNVCYVLGAVAVLFAIYSYTCAFCLTSNFAPFLKFIAITNGIYCLITTALVISHFFQMTILGFTYFFVETLIVLWVIRLEWRTAEKLLS